MVFRRLLIAVAAAVIVGLGSHPRAQQPTPPPHASVPPAPTFRSGVSLVSVSAVVRDKRGRVISTLERGDFEIFDEGQRPDVVSFHIDATAPASVALLVDGSGSMALAEARAQARRISTGVLARLTPRRDAVALLSFDTRLVTLCEFTEDFEQIRAGLGELEAYGSTSLYDAIAGAAGLVAHRARNRRAVIVITDGTDTASTHSPTRVAWIASTIDVPIYVFAVGAPPSDTSAGTDKWQPLAELARATGGALFAAHSPGLAAIAAARVTEELRHQYVLTFEPASAEGLRRLDVRTRHKDLRVAARAWYQASTP